MNFNGDERKKRMNFEFLNLGFWDFVNQKCNFFKSTDLQYFFTRFPEINFQGTIRINWCKEHGCGSTYMVVRLFDKRSIHLLVQMLFDHVQIFLTVFNIFWMCSNIWGSQKQFIQTVKRSKQFLVTECFFNLFLEVSHIQKNRTIIIQIGKDYWDRETCRKS